MTIELCSENPAMVMSPARISFSHDISQSDVVPVEQRRHRSSSTSGVDFDFCVHETFDQASSSADELFSDGKILPTQVKKNIIPPKPEPPSPSLSPSPCQNREIDETKVAISESDEKQSSKSFWRFKRSSSLNCGSGYASSLCPLPLLSRSNSTGSATKSKQNSQKNSAVAAAKSSQYSSSSGSHQKPPLKKSYANGVRINPVLNVPSGNLFGLGSIFFNGKEKSKRR